MRTRLMMDNYLRSPALREQIATDILAAGGRYPVGTRLDRLYRCAEHGMLDAPRFTDRWWACANAKRHLAGMFCELASQATAGGQQ